MNNYFEANEEYYRNDMQHTVDECFERFVNSGNCFQLRPLLHFAFMNSGSICG